MISFLQTNLNNKIAPDRNLCSVHMHICAANFPLLYDPYSRSVCSSHDTIYKTRKTLLGHKSHLMENVRQKFRFIDDKDFMCVMCKLLMFKILFLQTNLNNNIAPERNLCSTHICAANFPLLYDPYSRSVCSSHDMMYKTRKTPLGHKSRILCV